MYVNFINQFSSSHSEDAGPSVRLSQNGEKAARQKSVRHELMRLRRKGEKAVRQDSVNQERTSATPDHGEWTTGIHGNKVSHLFLPSGFEVTLQVFKTNDGKEYNGMKAYKMHARIVKKEKCQDENYGLN